jgi:hypothetical protein
MKKVVEVDSRLYYQNGYDNDDGTTNTISLSSSTSSSLLINNSDTAAAAVAAIAIPSASSAANKQQQRPRTVDLPRHSPPKKVIQRQKLLLDLEMMVGRIAMIAALILMSGEIITGLSMTDQVSGLL